MQVYIFQAALYCRDCGQEHRAGLDIPPGADLGSDSTFDSGDYPKGPYGDGGGEADCPQHCDDCRTFLENPLTADGVDYVISACADYLDGAESWPEVAERMRAAGGHDTAAAWVDFYGPALGGVPNAAEAA